MQKVLTDLTTWSEAQTNGLQSIVVLALGSPFLYHFHTGALHCTRWKVWATLNKKICSWPRTSFLVSAPEIPFWNVKQSLKASLKIILLKNLHVYITKDLKNPVLFSVENVSPQPLSSFSSIGPLKNQDLGSWLAAPGQGYTLKGDVGCISNPPVCHKPCTLAQGFLNLEAETHFPSLHKGAQQYLQLMHWDFLLYSRRYLLN